MAGVNLPERRPDDKKRSGKRRVAAKRPGVRTDMTPMVDIAFLLLIFYMVTTVFSMPQSLELNLPPKASKRVDIPETRLLQIWVDADGGIYWMHNKSSAERVTLPEPVNFKNLHSLLMRKNAEIANLVMVLKLDPAGRYESFINIIDEIQIVERQFKLIDPSWSCRFSIDDISEWEVQLMANARKLAKNKSS